MKKLFAVVFAVVASVLVAGAADALTRQLPNDLKMDTSRREFTGLSAQDYAYDYCAVNKLSTSTTGDWVWTGTLEASFGSALVKVTGCGVVGAATGCTIWIDGSFGSTGYTRSGDPGVPAFSDTGYQIVQPIYGDGVYLVDSLPPLMKVRLETITAKNASVFVRLRRK